MKNVLIQQHKDISWVMNCVDSSYGIMNVCVYNDM